MIKKALIPCSAAAFVLSALLAGCAATPTDSETDSLANADTPDPDAASTVVLAKSDVQCRRERKTGTHLYTKVCTTAAQREEMRKATQQWMRTGGRAGEVSPLTHGGSLSGAGPAANGRQ